MPAAVRRDRRSAADIEQRSFAAGAGDRAELVSTQVAASEARLLLLAAAYDAESAFGALEDAYRRPLQGAESELPLRWQSAIMNTPARLLWLLMCARGRKCLADDDDDAAAGVTAAGQFRGLCADARRSNRRWAFASIIRCRWQARSRSKPTGWCSIR